MQALAGTTDDTHLDVTITGVYGPDGRYTFHATNRATHVYGGPISPPPDWAPCRYRTYRLTDPFQYTITDTHHAPAATSDAETVPQPH